MAPAPLHDMRLQRTRSSPSALHSPLTRRPWGSGRQRTAPPAGRLATIAALVFFSVYLAPPLAAQTSILELDHIYIVVQPPASRAAEALRKAGLVVDPAINRHEGLGTASMAVFFANAYLELLWVDSATYVDPAHLGDIADYRRAATWRDSGASPFGVGLHFLTGAPEDLAFPVRRDPAPHLGPDSYYLLLRQPDEKLVPDVFIVPLSAAVTTWLSRYRNRRPDLFAHPLGAERITRVILCGSPANRPRAGVLRPRPIAFEPASTQYLVVEFDGGLKGGLLDLRPTLPLILGH